MQKIENPMFILSVNSVLKIFSENCLLMMQNSVAYLSYSELCKCFKTVLLVTFFLKSKTNEIRLTHPLLYKTK